MDESSIRMNLVAIQKVDPYAKEIIDSCPHVAFYKYIENEWQKSEIEGSFFIYSRVAEPFHSIFINNRLNTNSLVEPITKPIELQSQPPFLLYRNQRSAISGFWFYCKEDCVRIYALLEKLIRKASNSKADPAPNHSHNHLQQNHHPQQQAQGQAMNSHPPPLPPSQNVMSNGSNKSNNPDVDIFSMLSKAQAEFSNSGISTGLEQQLMDMKMQHQPIMKQISMTMPLDITSPNVVSFFAAAQQPNGVIPIMNAEGGNAQRSFISGVPHHPNVQQPPVQTLDEIEKQHRVASVSPKVEPKLLNNLLNSSIQQQQQPIQQNPQQPFKLLQQQIPSQNMAPKLIAPTMFQASNAEEKMQQQQQQQLQQMQFRPEPLTHNQLMQALNYLLENDPDFIRKVHEAYIKSFNKKISH